MTRRPFIAGNWKLNLGPVAARSLATELASGVETGGATVAVFPTALSITSVLEALADASIEVGIQEVEPHASGAYTGTNSATMAREAGCTYCLIGHSERRQIYGETDAGVNQKVHAAFAAGLLPVVCVGETLEERDADQVAAVVLRQVEAGLQGLEPDQVVSATIAYEPVWAIGTGRTATPEQAQEVHALIRGWLAQKYPAFVAEQTRILYGGSVKPANAAELMACPDIDGALVGGASLKADSFAAIVAAAK